MEIKSLPNNIRCSIRSTMNIHNVLHCVQELVFNSLDAKSTAIAVRINLQNFRIQVIDNGKGISKSDMDFIGIRYMTSKCQTLQDLKRKAKYYGYRGESLANIINVSERITITSKFINSNCTYRKVFENKQFSEINLEKERPEHGTTVTVENFLYNIPVRQKCINLEQNMEEVRSYMELLLIIHPRVSFSLRNDVNLKIILRVNKSNSVLHSFINLHPEITPEDILSCNVSKGSVSISGLIYKKLYSNKHLQLVYVNKRPVSCLRIYREIKLLYKTSHFENIDLQQSQNYPVYVINITCPYSQFEITFESSKANVEFKNWDLILKCIEKLFRKGWGCIQNEQMKKSNAVQEMSLSNMLDVVKTKHIKRKGVTSCEKNLNKRINVNQRKNEKVNFVLVDHKESSSEKSFDVDNVFTNNCNNQEEEGAVKIISSENSTENELKGKDLIMDYFFKSLSDLKEESHSDNQNGEDGDLSVITFNNIAKKKRIEQLNKPYYVRSNDTKSVNSNTKVQITCTCGFRKKEMISKAIQTSPEIKKLQLSNDDINTFHYYLPEEQEWAENFQHLGLKNTNHSFKSKNNRNLSFNCQLNCNIKSKDFSTVDTENLFTSFNNNSFTLIGASPIQIKKRKTNDENRNLTKKIKSNFFPEKHSSTNESRNKWKSSDDINELISKQPFEELFQNSGRKNINQIGLLGGQDVLQTAQKETRKIDTGNEKSISMQTLLFSVGDSDKEKLLESDLELEKQQYNKKKEFTQDCSVSKDFKTMSVAGIKTNVFDSPIAENVFKFKERLDILPKGCSPIMSAFSKVDKLLSPTSKKYLEETILKGFETEQQMVKWENYLNGNDLASFLDKLYEEKAKKYEKAIPKVLPTKGSTFSKDIFGEIVLLGQVDNKFIGVIHKNRHQVYFFDQHAVHERIRVEMLFKEYRKDQIYQSVPKYVSFPCTPNVSFKMDDSDLNIMIAYKTAFNDVGLDFIFIDESTVQIGKVPLCFINKANKIQGSQTMECLVKALISEIIETLKSTKGCLVTTPKIISDIINSEACRGAIKFGDSLTYEDMQYILNTLSRCQLPFQCAHGRPTLTPVIMFHETAKQSLKPNFKNLKKQ